VNGWRPCTARGRGPGGGTFVRCMVERREIRQRRCHMFAWHKTRTAAGFLVFPQEFSPLRNTSHRTELVHHSVQPVVHQANTCTARIIRFHGWGCIFFPPNENRGLGVFWRRGAKPGCARRRQRYRRCQRRRAPAAPGIPASRPHPRTRGGFPPLRARIPHAGLPGEHLRRRRYGGGTPRPDEPVVATEAAVQPDLAVPTSPGTEEVASPSEPERARDSARNEPTSPPR
jgi:hypothetical protein